jgi:hypothetical protein
MEQSSSGEKMPLQCGLDPANCFRRKRFSAASEPCGRRVSLTNVALGLLIVNSNYAGTPAVAMVLVFGVLSMPVALVYGKLMSAT